MLRRSLVHWAGAVVCFAACSSNDKTLVSGDGGLPPGNRDSAADGQAAEPAPEDVAPAETDGGVGGSGGFDAGAFDVAFGHPNPDAPTDSTAIVPDDAGTRVADVPPVVDLADASSVDAPSPMSVFARCTSYDHAENPDEALAVVGVLFTPDKKNLISLGTDGRAKVWEVTPTGLETPGSRLELKGNSWLSGAIRADGKYLAIGDDDGIVTVYDLPASLAAGAAVTVSTLSTVSGQGLVSDRGASARPRGFTADGNHLVVSYSSYNVGVPNQVAVWDLSTETVVRQINMHNDSDYPMAFLLGDYSTSMWIASEETVSADAGLDTVVTLIDMAKTPMSKVQFTIPNADAYSMAFSPDGSTLAIGFGDAEVSLWNISNGSSIALQDSPLIAGGSVDSWANVMTFCPDGNCLFTGFAGYSECSVKLSSMRQPRETITKALEYDGTALDISRDGLALAVGENNRGRILYCTP